MTALLITIIILVFLASLTLRPHEGYLDRPVDKDIIELEED